jgi:hypothetical protein
MTDRQAEPAMLTLAEAAAWLDPPISLDRLTELVHAARLQPVGKRPSRRGRPAHAYDAAELMDLHSRFRPYLE